MPYQGLPILAVLVNSQTPPIKIGIIIKKDSDQSMNGDNDLIQLVISQYGPQFHPN